MGVTCGAMQKLTALCVERELLQQNMHLNNGLCAVQTYRHYRNLRQLTIIQHSIIKDVPILRVRYKRYIKLDTVDF